MCIFGTDDSETLSGTNGRDILYGGKGRDGIYGKNGNDEIYGEDGRDQLYGGDGNDVLGGGRDGDEIEGGRGSDYIYTGAEDDLIRGGDTFGDPSDNADVLDYTNYWNAGDTFPKVEGTHWVGDGSWKKATFYLDKGGDSYAFFEAATNLADLDGGEYPHTPPTISNVKMTGIEHIILGVGDQDVGIGDFSIHNTVYGNGADNIFIGGKYNDHLEGGTGSDKLVGGRGNDVLTGGDGIDYAVYESKFPPFYAEENADGDLVLGTTSLAGEGADTIRGVERFIFGASAETKPGAGEPITITGETYELNLGDDGYQSSDFTLVG